MTTIITLKEIFSTNEEDLDNFLSSNSSPEFMKMAKQLITCILVDKKNLLDSNDSKSIKSVVNIDDFENLKNGFDFKSLRDKNIKFILEDYKVTYSNLIMERLKLSIFFMRSDSNPREFVTFNSQNPDFENKSREYMAKLEESCEIFHKQLKEFNIPLLDDLLETIKSKIQEEYRVKGIDFYKSDYYNNKNFESFINAIGEIYLKHYSESEKAKYGR